MQQKIEDELINQRVHQECCERVSLMDYYLNVIPLFHQINRANFDIVN